jgi:tetratricopeptide (TPR) repeat protein
MTKACVILPPAPEDFAAIARMAKVAGQMDTNDSTWGFSLIAQGLAEYRMQHYAEAADLLQRVLPLDVGTHARTIARFGLAMAQFQLKQPDQSRETLARAVDAVERQLPKAGRLGDAWTEWIICHVLMREANELIR